MNSLSQVPRCAAIVLACAAFVSPALASADYSSFGGLPSYAQLQPVLIKAPLQNNGSSPPSCSPRCR